MNENKHINQNSWETAKVVFRRKFTSIAVDVYIKKDITSII